MNNRDDPVVVVIQPPSPHQAVTNVTECQICMEDKPLTGWISDEEHRCCQECRIRYIAGLVLEGQHVDLPCFAPNCPDKLPSDLVREELRRFQPDLVQTYEEKLVKRYLLTTKDVIWCPGPNCTYAAIYSDIDKCPTLQCPVEGCATLICPKCTGKSHEGVDCPPPLQLYGVKTCPKCGVRIERTEGCPNMTCTVCSQDFCWICGKPGQNHHHQLWNWPTHPCFKWPSHMLLIVTFFVWGFLMGVMMGLMMFPMRICNEMNICLRVLMSIATFIGFPIVGVCVAIMGSFMAAVDYQFAIEQIEELLVGRDRRERLILARGMAN